MQLCNSYVQTQYYNLLPIYEEILCYLIKITTLPIFKLFGVSDLQFVYDYPWNTLNTYIILI